MFNITSFSSVYTLEPRNPPRHDVPRNNWPWYYSFITGRTPLTDRNIDDESLCCLHVLFAKPNCRTWFINVSFTNVHFIWTAGYKEWKKTKKQKHLKRKWEVNKRPAGNEIRTQVNICFLRRVSCVYKIKLWTSSFHVQSKFQINVS